MGNVCCARPGPGRGQKPNPLDWNKVTDHSEEDSIVKEAKSVSNDGKVLISSDREMVGLFSLIDNNVEDITINIDTSNSKKTKEEAPIVIGVWTYARRDIEKGKIYNEKY